MNEVACDLEDPFIGAPNQVPLAAMHASFNEDMLSYGWEYGALAQPRGVFAHSVGALPPAAARAAAAAQRAQGGGAGTAVMWAGSPYTVLTCYLVPQQPDVASAPAADAKAAEAVPDATNGAGMLRRSASAQAMPPPSPAAALLDGEPALRFYA